MSTTQLLIDTAERIFTDYCDKTALDIAEAGEFPAALWAVLQDAGFHELAVIDNGVGLSDVFAILKVAGRHAVPLPLSEILFANRWLHSTDGFATIGLRRGDEVIDLPWGRKCDRVLALTPASADAESGSANLVLVEGSLGTLGQNLAGEARDTYHIDSQEVVATAEDAFVMLALGRTVQMAGALERVMALSLQYVGEREQFGRTISRFQAIQHILAVMAAETAAAARAADAAVAAAEQLAPGGPSERFVLEVAAAKSRVGEAGGRVVEMAHQVHGAMGYTHEHRLHHYTRRVWAWRDEYGTESHWQLKLGSQLAAIGADGLWDFLATRG